MRFPVIAEVQAYWEALRRGRPVPLRSEVDPRGIERALPHAFIVERIAPGMARFRLAGQHLNDLMGMEVRGMPLTSFLTPPARDRMAAVLEAVFATPATADLALSGEGGAGRPSVVARMILLPLQSDLGDITRALGCLATLGPIGRTPRRFEIGSVQQAPVCAGGDAALPLPLQHMAEPPAAFQPAQPQQAARPRPALRLVQSGD